MPERFQEFDVGQFVKDYTAASSLQGTVIARALYTLQTQMNQRFDEVDRRFDEVDRRFEGVDQRFEGIDQRFEGVDQRFDQVDRTLDRIVRVLALAHPDEYRQAFSENGHKPPE